jgi:GcrA cell cycle regulator
MIFWSDAEDARLAALAADGLTASQIAAALRDEFGNGRSRNAVIGRMLRVGLALRSRLAPRPRKRDVPPAPRPARPAKVRPMPAFSAPAGAAVRAPMPPVPNLPATLPVSFLDAVFADTCPHFVGDPLGRDGPDMPVCGAERAQSASRFNRYCRRHLAGQYQGVPA